VRRPHLVVKELGADVADELGQLSGVTQQLTVRVELHDARRECLQQCLEVSRAPLVVRLLRLRHASASTECSGDSSEPDAGELTIGGRTRGPGRGRRTRACRALVRGQAAALWCPAASGLSSLKTTGASMFRKQFSPSICSHKTGEWP